MTAPFPSRPDRLRLAPPEPSTGPTTRPAAPTAIRDAGQEAHRAAIAHLQACGEAMDAAEETGNLDAGSPAVGPYCGCGDCDVRETLAAAWPILLADAAAIVDRAGHTNAADPGSVP